MVLQGSGSTQVGCKAQGGKTRSVAMVLQGSGSTQVRSPCHCHSMAWPSHRMGRLVTHLVNTVPISWAVRGRMGTRDHRPANTDRGCTRGCSVGKSPSNAGHMGKNHSTGLSVNQISGPTASRVNTASCGTPTQRTHTHTHTLLWLRIPSGFLVVFEKPNRSSFTPTATPTDTPTNTPTNKPP
jgi:hypothetical protein